ncbi:MAG: chlorophyllase [Promicromonosporaceae bacterium]|nr:chlorophyllase [Promicromonosporaceae bacterium]
MSVLAPPSAVQTVSVRPVLLPAAERGEDIQVRVTAPATGEGLPVIVLAHGFGGSMTGYDPLVDHWTAHGFVVVQPTFLDSATLAIAPEDPRYTEIWRIRVDDLVRVIDDLPTVLGAVPGLADRADTERLAVAGHSWGGQSVGMLLGARVLGADGQPGEDRTDPRVKAGVLLATTGLGGDDLSPFARQAFPFMSPDFDRLATPALVVAGDNDRSPLSTRGPDWFTDVYFRSPGARALLTLFGAEHSLGGIHAYRSADTTDERPETVALVAQASTAFLQRELGVDAAAWDREVSALAGEATPAGRIDVR